MHYFGETFRIKKYIIFILFNYLNYNKLLAIYLSIKSKKEKMDFNINDIEEVESTPNRRTREENINNHRHNHQHHHHHNHTHSQNNGNDHKHIRRRVFIKKFEFPERLLMCIFLSSTFVLCFSFFINMILAVKGIITPRLFLPSIIMFIVTFMFSGGILGTYVSPPPGIRTRIRKGEILLMRYLTPIIMSIMSIIFLSYGEKRLKYLKSGMKRAQNLCQENSGLSMEQIYAKLNQTNYELEHIKYNLISTFNQNLVCFPKGKCIKLIEDNNYICNTDEFIEYNNIVDVKCNKINFNDKNNYNIDKNQNANLFFENCKEINNNTLASIDIFICESNINLEKIKLIPNWNENDKTKIENYFNNKIDNCNIQINKNQQIMKIYDNSDYSYDLECYRTMDYNLSYFMINSYRIIFYFIGFSWIFLGICGIYQFLKIAKNGRIDNISSDEMKEINGIQNNEDNKLMIDPVIKNDDKYIELTQNPV